MTESYSLDGADLNPTGDARFWKRYCENLDRDHELKRIKESLGRDGDCFGLLPGTGGGYRFSIPNEWNLIDIQSDNEAFEFVRASGTVFSTPASLPFMKMPLATRENHAKLAELLLTEAVAARKSTVPQDAVVEFSIGDFKSVEIREQRDTVYFSWRDAVGVGRFVCRIKLSCEQFEWEIVTNGLGALRERLRSGHVTASNLCDSDLRAIVWARSYDDDEFAALYFLSAAILRDFWVVEDRSSAFRLGMPRIRRTSGRDGKKRSTIIYLPRCKYSREKVTAAANTETKIWNVSPHFIRSHFRILGEGHSASVKQRAVASLHGVSEIPEGKTWVRAHVTGHVKDRGLVRYRSRTASRSLFDVIDLRQVTLLDGINWFQFERLCEKLMQDRGYTILDKVGDGGIDILAVNSGGKFALGQAKHWAEKVGPSVIREMIGTRSDFETKHRTVPVAIILSSSGFTSAAKAGADAAGIELITVHGEN